MAVGGSQAGGDLYNVILGWQQLGIYDVILPFLLIFTIAFAVFEKVKIFGDGKKNIHIILSLVMGLLFLQNNYIVYLISRRFLPNVAMFMVIILILILFIGIFVGEYKGFSGWVLTIAAVFSIGAIIYSLVTEVTPYPGTGFWDWILYSIYSMDPMTKGTLLFLIVIGVVIAIFSGGTGSSAKNFVSDLESGLRGGGSKR